MLPLHCLHLAVTKCRYYLSILVLWFFFLIPAVLILPSRHTFPSFLFFLSSEEDTDNSLSLPDITVEGQLFKTRDCLFLSTDVIDLYSYLMEGGNQEMNKKESPTSLSEQVQEQRKARLLS